MKRVLFKPKFRICCVEYLTKDGFLKALNNAGEYRGNMFEVSVDNTVETKKKKNATPSKPVWLDDVEVEDELKAMSGVGTKSNLFTQKGKITFSKKNHVFLEFNFRGVHF